MSTILSPDKTVIPTVKATPQLKQARAVKLPRKVTLGGGFTLLVLVTSELLIRAGTVPATSFPPPSSVFQEFLLLLFSSAFWSAIGQTVLTSVLGILIIIAIATPLALLIGLSGWVRESTWFLIEFLKPIPPVALIPLGLILWGPSPTMKLLLVCFGAIWPLLTQLVYGVREVSGVALDMARSYRLGWRKTTAHVVIPSVFPFAVTGLRVTAAIAIVISVVVEMVGGAPGLGQSITVAQTANAMPTMYALILAAGFLGLFINGIFVAIEKRLLFWHASQAKDKS